MVFGVVVGEVVVGADVGLAVRQFVPMAVPLVL
jgi:hypothetical protein